MGEFPALFDSVPMAILTATFIGILLTSFGVLLQALYLAGDMEFLMSVPIPIRAVFIAKMLQAILPNTGLISLFGLPLLFGMGIANQYNFIYYPLAIFLLISISIAAAGLASLLVMAIVKIVPPRRVAEALAFFGAVISMVCSQSGQIINSFGLSEVSGTQFAQNLGTINRLNSPWNPLSWASKGLLSIGEAKWLEGFAFIMITFVITWGIFAISLVIAEKLYYVGWATMQISPQRKKLSRSKQLIYSQRKPLKFQPTLLLPPQIRAIFVKDFLVLRRDLRNMSQVITPLIFGIIYGIILLRGGADVFKGKGEAPQWFMNTVENGIMYVRLALALFIGWSLVSRLAMISFSQEGKNYWLIKTAPVGIRRLILSKFLTAYTPSVLLGWIFLLGITLIDISNKSSLSIFLFGLPVIALCNAGITGINLAFGIRGANLNWEDPRHMSSGQVGCFAAIATLIYLPLILILFFAPPVAFSLFGLSIFIGQIIALMLGGIVSITCAVLPPWFVRGYIPLLGEG